MENISIFEDKKTNIAYISFYIFDNEKQKIVRKKKSTKLKYNSKNIKYIEEKVIPALQKQKEQGKGLLANKRIDIEKVSSFSIELFKELEKESGQRRVYTNKGYKRSFELHFLPVFGHRMLRDISADELQNFFLNLKLSSKRKSNIKIPISLMFQKAIRMEILNSNPLLNVDKSLFKTVKKRETAHLLNIEDKKSVIEDSQAIDPFSESEIKKILTIATGKFKNYVGILFFTGMRPSELIYLDWKNVNFKKKYVIIEGAITGKQEKDEEELTKTYSSHRVIYLSNKALSFFENQFKETGSFNSKVFLNQYNSAYTSPNSFRDNDWRKLFDLKREQIEKGKKRETVCQLNNLGIRYRNIYNLRHSFASINLSLNRLPLLLVSKQMGHSTAEITLRKYSSYIVDDNNITLELLDKSTEFYS